MKRTLPQHLANLSIIGKSVGERLLRDLGQDGTAGRWLVFDLNDDNEWLFATRTEAGADRMCKYLNKVQTKHVFDYETLPAGKHRTVSLTATQAGLRDLQPV